MLELFELLYLLSVMELRHAWANNVSDATISDQALSYLPLIQ